MRLRRHPPPPLLPGVHGTVRPVRPGTGDAAQATRALARRVGPGDVAVVDHLDLDRVSAEALAAARPAVVVNVRQSVSGRHPSRGAEVLVAAGIAVVDGTGPGLLSEIRDGGTVRIYQGQVYAGERLLGSGTMQTADSILTAQERARAGMNRRLEAVGTDTAHFLAQHEAMLLDGVGLPTVSTTFTGRCVLVVAPGDRAAAQARALRRWVRETRPIVVSADDGTTAAIQAGLRPDLVVGEMPEPPSRALAKAEHLDTEAVPEGLSASDLAVVLAADGDAALVVLTGSPASFDEMLDRERSAAASLLAVRLRGGERVVDAEAVLALQRPPIGLGPVLALLAGGAAAVAAALLAVPGGHDLLQRLRDVLPW